MQTDLSHGLPYEVQDQAYDIAMATGCLEFIANHPRLLQQVYEALKPKALFWLTLQMSDRQLSINSKDFRQTYSEIEAKTLLQDTGFKILDFIQHPAGYVSSTNKQKVPYFLVIGQR